MKKILFVCAALVLAFTGCRNSGKRAGSEGAKAETAVPDTHTSRNSLDYEGTYKGVLPCADCEGIEVTVKIDLDGNYTREMKYLGIENAEEIVRERGKYLWNAEGSVIELEGAAASNKYQVGENALFHLDINGKRITGDLADMYILRKE